MSPRLKVCSHCTTPNPSQSVICNKCGSPLSPRVNNPSPGTQTALTATRTSTVGMSWTAQLTHEGLWPYAIISFIFPFVGLVLYLVQRKANFKSADVCRKAAIAGFVSGMLIGGFFKFPNHRKRASKESLISVQSLRLTTSGQQSKSLIKSSPWNGKTKSHHHRLRADSHRAGH